MTVQTSSGQINLDRSKELINLTIKKGQIELSTALTFRQMEDLITACKKEKEKLTEKI